VIDVGCGPGALTEELAARVGAERVSAADPSTQFARACAARVAGADVREAPAEQLPWPAGSFDAALAQLVVSFLQDADAGVGEMRRVVRPGGVVAACTWDYASGMQLLRAFWDAALALNHAAADEARVMRHTDPDSLRALWVRSGLRDVETAPLVVQVQYASVEDLWQPFLGGVGPAGAYTVSLDARDQAALREECLRRLGSPEGSFVLSARAWAVRGVR